MSKLPQFVPVYRRSTTPSHPYSLKLLAPAFVLLGYNIYMNEWATTNITFLAILSTLAFTGTFGAAVRLNSTITSIYLNKGTNKLHLTLKRPRR